MFHAVSLPPLPPKASQGYGQWHQALRYWNNMLEASKEEEGGRLSELLQYSAAYQAVLQAYKKLSRAEKRQSLKLYMAMTAQEKVFSRQALEFLSHANLFFEHFEKPYGFQENPDTFIPKTVNPLSRWSEKTTHLFPEFLESLYRWLPEGKLEEALRSKSFKLQRAHYDHLAHRLIIIPACLKTAWQTGFIPKKAPFTIQKGASARFALVNEPSFTELHWLQETLQAPKPLAVMEIEKAPFQGFLWQSARLASLLVQEKARVAALKTTLSPFFQGKTLTLLKSYEATLEQSQLALVGARVDFLEAVLRDIEGDKGLYLVDGASYLARLEPSIQSWLIAPECQHVWQKIVARLAQLEAPLQQAISALPPAKTLIAAHMKGYALNTAECHVIEAVVKPKAHQLLTESFREQALKQPLLEKAWDKVSHLDETALSTLFCQQGSKAFQNELSSLKTTLHFLQEAQENPARVALVFTTLWLNFAALHELLAKNPEKPFCLEAIEALALVLQEDPKLQAAAHSRDYSLEASCLEKLQKHREEALKEPKLFRWRMLSHMATNHLVGFREQYLQQAQCLEKQQWKQGIGALQELQQVLQLQQKAEKAQHVQKILLEAKQLYSSSEKPSAQTLKVFQQTVETLRALPESEPFFQSTSKPLRFFVPQSFLPPISEVTHVSPTTPNSL